MFSLLRGIHVAQADHRRPRPLHHGRSSPASPTRLGSPMPRATASGMPWMLPLGLVSGVFMSPWASNQMRPMRSSLLAWNARDARRWCPWRSSGRRPAPPAGARRRAPASTSSRTRLAGLADLAQVLHPRIAGVVRLLDGDVDVARVVDLVAQRAHAGVDVGDAEGGRPHVHAAAPGAQVQGHADERDLLAGHAVGDASTRSREGSTEARAAPPDFALRSGGRWLRLRPASRPPPPAAPAEPTVDILPILVTRKVLTARAGRARAPLDAHERRPDRRAGHRPARLRQRGPDRAGGGRRTPACPT